MKRAKPALILLLKVLISTALLGYFLTRIHIERFIDTFASADLRYIGLTLVIYLLSQLVSVVRWWVLAQPLGFKTPLPVLLRYFLIGMFFNLFAPGTVGGDVSRIYYLSSDGDPPAKEQSGSGVMHAAVSVLMDRAVGMVVLVWLGALGLFFFPEYRVPGIIRTTTYALAIGFIIVGLAAPFFTRLLPETGYSLFAKLRVALASYKAHWRAIPQAIALSFVIHFIQSWIHLILGRAIQIDIPFSYCIIVYPLVGTFSAIPISLNGLGLREGGYLFLLKFIGISSEKGVAFGLLLFLAVAIDSLIGGLIFILNRAPKPSRIGAEVEP